MSSTENVVGNVLLNGLLFYGIGRKLRGHRTSLRLGLALGMVSGLVAWVVDRRGVPVDTPE